MRIDQCADLIRCIDPALNILGPTDPSGLFIMDGRSIDINLATRVTPGDQTRVSPSCRAKMTLRQFAATRSLVHRSPVSNRLYTVQDCGNDANVV
jgi:hypothetical protein